MNATRRRKIRGLTWRAGSPAGASSAFTIVEMLMVVAIMALLTVGIAQVFRVTGETVKAGKRISNLNAYAAMVEKQVRSDFASLTRDGFMVIRHRTAGGTAPAYANEPIALAPDDPAPRQRRVDEIVFFAAGDFTTARDPIHPSRQAKALQARIYYGHGHRKDPSSDTFYDPLRLDDFNNTTDTPKFGQPGPNRYASDWTLLRHVALLTQPRVTAPTRLPNTLVDPNPVYTGGDPNDAPGEDLDSRVQIELQPAAASIFRYLMPVIPLDTHPRFGNNFVVRDDNSGARPARPRFSSGIVDICATDLTEIRAILLDAQPFFTRSPLDLAPFSLDNDTQGQPPYSTGTDRVKGSFFFNDINPAANNSSTRLMQAWMREALPANSDAGERMRYELSPPNFLGNIGASNGGVYDKEYHRTDQNMLTASNFVPGCTEFIVEWSFGKAYPFNDPQGRAGQLIWHGMRRDAGVTPGGQPAYAALPYGDPLASGADLYHMPYQRKDGTTGYWPPLPGENMAGGDTPLPAPGFNINVVRQYNPFASANVPEYSYFGYVDPSFRMRSAWTDANGNGLFDSGEAFEDKNGNLVQDNAAPGEPKDEPDMGNGDRWFDPGLANEKPDPNEPSTIPWPWPKLVRITMSIADPADPLREQTFQFVMEVPQGPGNVN